MNYPFGVEIGVQSFVFFLSVMCIIISHELWHLNPYTSGISEFQLRVNNDCYFGTQSWVNDNDQFGYSKNAKAMLKALVMPTDSAPCKCW